MPDITPEAQAAPKPTAIRADIAKMVGLDPDKAAEIARQRDQEAQVVRITRQNGEEAYDRLDQGLQIDSVALGVGQFDISPIDKVTDLVPNVQKRVQEITPPPPEEHIKLYLDSFAKKALEKKNYEAAVACYNYITDEQLTTEENHAYLEKLASAATTPDEKYDLYLALQQVLPQAQSTQETPQIPIVPTTVKPEAAITAAPVSAESVAADEAAWRAAAGISPATSEPKMPINAPLQPDASLFSSAPPIEAQPQPDVLSSITTPPAEALPPIIHVEVPPTPVIMPVNATAAERPFPQPQPIKAPNMTAPKPFEITPPAANFNAPHLRPVPTREEAAAQGLIEDVASRIPTTPPISSSEAELARAA
jgi:hypothetical protein